jgi:short subunit dehydrogenase-like uncharacterized protein
MAEPSRILVYGATGFTAGIIVQAMMQQGVEPILSARNPGELESVARRFGLEWRAASLDDPAAFRRALDGAKVVVNAAGPFRNTVDAVLRGCLEAGAHYMDVSGEVDAMSAAAAHHEEASARHVTILCGAGFDVVPSDCLVAHVVKRCPGARRLRVGISGLELASPGSMKTLTAELGRPTRVRRDGRLIDIPPGSLTCAFDFGLGPKACLAVTWGDLVSAYYSTGVGNIETYFEATLPVTGVVQMNRTWGWAFRLPGVQSALERQTALWARPPTATDMRAKRAAVVVAAEDASGVIEVSRLITPEAYTLTAQTAAVIAEKLLSGDYEPGFQTPSRLFGPDFILRFDGVSREDLESRA